MKLLVLFLALVQGGWLLFDGCHAFWTGDYVTPKNGSHAGRLGPWAAVWRGMGIDPRSGLVRGVHVIVGAFILVALVAYALDLPRSRVALVAGAALGLWYLPFGTLLGLVQIALLLTVLRPR